MKLCRIYRRAMVFWLDEPAAPRWLGQHLERCPECRAAWETERRFIQQLGSQTPPRPEPVPFLRARIVANVRAQTPPGAHAEVRVLRPVGLAAFGLALVLALALLSLPGKKPAQPVAVVAPRATQPPTVLARVVDGTELLRLVDRIDEPLETELQSVVNDARTALNSLAYNF